jgi:ribonuclease P protein subunit POP4
MALTPINLIKHELIGLHAKVVKSTNASNEGVEGRIVDESYRTITIESNGKDKKIFKENVILIVELPDRKKVQVEGKLLLARPWERIKKKFPKY